LGGLTAINHSLAVKLASIPDDIRGYGHVKDAHLAKAQRKQQDLLAQWRHPPVLTQAAE
jgi:indolepyruvate ferredoxin oxidoreductase